MQYGLAFAPLEEHVAELWIDARAREHPAVAAIGELLRSAAFTAGSGSSAATNLTTAERASDA